MDDEVLRVEIAQRRRRRARVKYSSPYVASSTIGTRYRSASFSSSRRVRIGIVTPVGFWNVGFV